MRMKGDLPPADNPTTALFDLAQEMADNYYKIRFVKQYAYVFLGVLLLFLGVLVFYFFLSDNLALAIISLALFISTLMLFRLIMFIKYFLDHFDRNFRAIRMVTEVDPLPALPGGKSPRERMKRYLEEKDPECSRELGRGAKAVMGYRLGGDRWDVGIHRPGKLFSKPGYLVLAAMMEGEPCLKDFLELEKRMERALNAAGHPPDRAIMAYRAAGDYDGVSEDLYAYLTEKEHFLVQKGKKVRLRIQLFVETGGRYEIIPLLP